MEAMRLSETIICPDVLNKKNTLSFVPINKPLVVIKAKLKPGRKHTNQDVT